MESKKRTVSIIGSGFGALSLAVRLQAKGFEVTIYEKNDQIGGHASQYKEKGYVFDLGPSVVTIPMIIERIFESAGKKMEDYIDLVPLDPYYRIYFHDKQFIDYVGETERMKQEMAKFSKEDADNYEKFMEYTSKLYKVVIEDELGATSFDLKLLLKFLPEAIKLNAFLPEFSIVKRYFTHPYNQFAFSFHPLFIGGNPFNTPALYLMISYLEKKHHVWFAKGGMYTIVKALENVFLEKGGKIKLNSEVSKILVKDKTAIGIRSNNIDLLSDIVVSNAHFAHTYKELIEPQYRKKWNDKKVENVKYSMSCFLIYLGVKKKYPALKHHTMILSERYKELIEDIFKHKILPDDFSMYLHIPSQTDKTMAPEGCESMYLLIPVANLRSDINWEEVKESYADKILDFLQYDFGLEGLKESIEVKKIYTPEDFRNDRNNFLGSAWGAEPLLIQTATFKASNRSEDIRNLYLVGANTHPGPGVPGVMLSAEATEKVIFEDLNIEIKERTKNV